MVIVTLPRLRLRDGLTSFFLGSAYAGSGQVLRIILVSMLVATLNQPLSVYRQARGQERAVARVLMAASARARRRRPRGRPRRSTGRRLRARRAAGPDSDPALSRMPSTAPDELPSGEVSHLRICEVLLSPSYGGAETMALLLSDRFRRAGHDVDIVALDPATGPRPDRANDDRVVPASRLAIGHRLRRVDGARRLLPRARRTTSFRPTRSCPTSTRGWERARPQSHADRPHPAVRSRRLRGAGRPASSERTLLGRTAAVVAVSERLARRQYCATSRRSPTRST